MSRVSSLYRLQEIDLELDAGRARLAEIARALADHPAVEAARRRLLSAENHYRSARVALQELELENGSLAAKIREAEQRLYSGRIRNPKELQDLQTEIESLKRRLAANEERQLNALIESEVAETQAAGSQNDLQAAENEAAHQQSVLTAERDRCEARQRQLAPERETLRAALAEADRQVYDRLRQTKHGRALARLEAGACSACGLEPTPAVRQEARRAVELVRCAGCDRILYAD